jgi:hypothetical protein
MTNASKIQIGRLVRYFAGYGSIDGVGAIVAVHGTPSEQPAETIGGVLTIVRDGDCTVDVILDDGREVFGLYQSSIDRPGIGIKLLDSVLDSVDHLFVLAAQAKADAAIAKAKARVAFEAAEASRVINDPPVFFWNGIKDAKGDKLQRVHYSMGPLLNLPEGTITIYARDYSGLSNKVCECFAVQNDSDSQVDYFCKDTIRVIPQHPLYASVKAAYDAQQARYSAKYGRAAA